MVIELKSYECDHKYDFRPNLRDTKFNYHFISPILKSRSFSDNLNIYLYSFLEIRFLILMG